MTETVQTRVPRRRDLALVDNLERLRDAIIGSPMNHGLHLIGDHWSLSVIRAAFQGARQFEQFRQQLDIPKQTLSQRLKELVRLGIMATLPYQTNPVRLDYRLTDKGRALYPNVLMSWAWERKWNSDTSALPARLTHKTCGKRFLPQCVCAACHMPASLHDMEAVLSLDPVMAPLPPRSRRWSGKLPDHADHGATDAAGNRLLAFGLTVDRWSLLVICALYLGCHRFDQLQYVLSVGSSVLANRLAMLCDTGLLLRQPDLQDGRRFIYRLTPASHDLFHHVVTMSRWVSDRHYGTGSTVSMVHRDCGHEFVPDVVCDQCGEVLHARDVKFDY